MKLYGRVWKFGDNIDTDIIIPAHYLHSSDPDYLGKHCMKPIRPNFFKRVKIGDIIVAGKNFGCGSSREHAPIAIKACGIGCVIAKSFARIFFRNAINTGLPVIENSELFAFIKEGEKLHVNLLKGIIINPATEKKFEIQPFPPFLQKIISAGGLMNYILKFRRQK